ncbi:MAG: hypothetical protein WAW96_00460 [Alphaproteobacteria bacterium]
MKRIVFAIVIAALMTAIVAGGATLANKFVLHQDIAQAMPSWPIAAAFLFLAFFAFQLFRWKPSGDGRTRR